mmetsp:Transcript_100501/g.322500  ORF Transcript_100501/g.322500 Transcript_100501/m.322500 type:complete len:214 (+) Transcript_100501:847-1488(+)
MNSADAPFLWKCSRTCRARRRGCHVRSPLVQLSCSQMASATASACNFAQLHHNASSSGCVGTTRVAGKSAQKLSSMRDASAPSSCRLGGAASGPGAAPAKASIDLRALQKSGTPQDGCRACPEHVEHRWWSHCRQAKTCSNSCTVLPQASHKHAFDDLNCVMMWPERQNLCRPSWGSVIHSTRLPEVAPNNMAEVRGACKTNTSPESRPRAVG